MDENILEVCATSSTALSASTDGYIMGLGTQRIPSGHRRVPSSEACRLAACAEMRLWELYKRRVRRGGVAAERDVVNEVLNCSRAKVVHS